MGLVTIGMTGATCCAGSGDSAGAGGKESASATKWRIKRKVERWRAKYAALPAAERLAIMAALNEVDAG